MPCRTSRTSRCRSTPRRPAISPLEAEQRITFPIETALAGLPRLEYTRSLSRYGLSQVTAVFAGRHGHLFRAPARRRASRRSALATAARARAGARVPIATGLGEIFMYTVTADEGTTCTPTDLRTVQDWIIRPQLRQTPGVVEVNTVGGYEKAFIVAPRPSELLAYDLTFRRHPRRHRQQQRERRRRLHRAQRLAIPDSFAGPGHRHRGLAQTSSSRSAQASRVRLSQVADIEVGHELRAGAATQDGKEIVLGTVFMLVGENSRTVARAAAERLEADRSRRCPAGHQRGSDLRPNLAGRCDDRDGDDESRRRRTARHRGAVRVARQYARGARDCRRHSDRDAVHDHRHGGLARLGQPDEPGRARLRSHRRWRGHHRRELPAPPRRGASENAASAHTWRSGSPSCARRRAR